MTINERVPEAIYRAIDEVNELLPKDHRMKKSVDTALYGRTGSLDSLGLVNLIVSVERKIEEEFNVGIVLADEKLMSQKNDPFRSVLSLAGHVAMLLEEKLDGKRKAV